MNPRAELLEKVETLQNMLISYSRYETANVDAAEFKRLRDELLHDSTIKDRLPPELCTKTRLGAPMAWAAARLPGGWSESALIVP
jgi:hypothetical protein